jgi:hypothetical protein
MKYYTKPVPSDMAILYETYTTKDILDEYFPAWCEMMIQGGSGEFLSTDKCIDDWILMNHAWESDSEGYHVFTSSASEASV